VGSLLFFGHEVFGDNEKRLVLALAMLHSPVRLGFDLVLCSLEVLCLVSDAGANSVWRPLRRRVLALFSSMPEAPTELDFILFLVRKKSHKSKRS